MGYFTDAGVLDTWTATVDYGDGSGLQPPSKNLYWGWWFAGYGIDVLGSGDVVLGSREYGYADVQGCRRDLVGLRYGRITERCDQVHFYSMHSGGANFLFADGSVRFVNYSADRVLRELATMAGGEVVSDY